MLRPVLVSAIFVMLLTGLAYPMSTALVARILFPFQSRGSLLERDGAVVGSAIVGQNFTRPEYFHPRPSLTMGPDPADASKTIAAPYNAGLSGASNQGPTNQKLLDDVKARVEAYRNENGLAPDATVPVDAVTGSASGLDPHITIANARIQAGRVARARRVDEAEVLRLIDANTSGRWLGLFGEPRINVLQLNLALDTLPASKAK
ncbi:Potassium-transporting ATPase C chain [Labilithrix luteola]|uniref:Potassium-transporting ATPase KdpC subunit n=2 Tax=Labilithrix luteola TaxID=1391654 RepID=A0A0K1PWA0_9BACT|nr:Potassium-transporting ATPase C chain [Labilithrix luteola]